MALNAQNQNLISEIMNTDEELLDIQNRLKLIILRFNENNVYNEATDQELAGIPTFAHLTQSKVGNAVAAYIAIDALLEANSAAHRVALALTKG